jgi:hypothetical protein
MYRSILLWALLVWALLGAAACAVRRPSFETYRLVREDAGDVLIPPGLASPRVSRRTFATAITAGGSPCRLAGGGVAIQTRKDRVRATVNREELSAQPPGWLAGWAAEIEANGCVAPGAGSNLAERIAESLPLPPNAAFRLLHSNLGDIDLKTRLQVISPILKEGAAPDAATVEPVEISGKGASLTLTVKSSPNLIGYETAWYGVQPNPTGPGFTIAPLFAERRIEGKVERRPQPSTNYFSFPPSAAFYRLVYKAEQTEFTAFVVAAHTRSELEQRAKTLETGAGSCEKLGGELCIAIPMLVAVNQFVAVSVNGREIMVRWGAPVGEAIREAGERQPRAILPRLEVSKLYGSHLTPIEFDHSNPAILDMILTGGEAVSWK